MSENLTLNRNTFQETLVGLEFTSTPEEPGDIYSRACVESFTNMDWTRFGYPFTQVFEPGVLYEVAHLEGAPLTGLLDLSYRPTVTVERLADMIDNMAELAPTSRVNLASALINISRFDLAERVLDALTGTTDPREAFETAWLAFMVSNRRDDGRGSPDAFARMRAAALSGEIPSARILEPVPRRWCGSSNAARSPRATSGGSRPRAVPWPRGLTACPRAPSPLGTGD